MFSKRMWLVGGLAVLLAGGALLVERRQHAEAAFPRCKLDGVWLVQFGDGLFYQTFVTDALGVKGTVSLDPVVDSDPTLGGLFPDAESPAPGARGNIRRISRDSWEFSIISHGRRSPAQGEPGEVIYIEVLEGIARLVDCDTEAATIDLYRVYTADADSDGDGFPDDGAEPLIVLEGLEGTAKRI